MKNANLIYTFSLEKTHTDLPFELSLVMISNETIDLLGVPLEERNINIPLPSKDYFANSANYKETKNALVSWYLNILILLATYS